MNAAVADRERYTYPPCSSERQQRLVKRTQEFLLLYKKVFKVWLACSFLLVGLFVEKTLITVSYKTFRDQMVDILW